MKGRMQLIAVVVIAASFLAPGAEVFADEAEAPSGLWSEVVSWISSLIEGEGEEPEALGAQPPANALIEPEVSILIPPGG